MLVSLIEFYFNMVYSLLGDEFKQYIENKIVESNNKIDNMKGNKFSVLTSMAKVFAETKFNSSNWSVLCS